MPRNMYPQTAVYWTLTGQADSFGRMITSTPVEINCRWVAKTKNLMNPDGSVRVSEAKIYLEQDVEIGGFLVLSTLAALEDSSNPENNDDANEILSFRKIPNGKADSFLRVALV